MSLCSVAETGMRADTKLSWTSESFWNMSVVTPPLLYATAPAIISKKSLYSSNGSRKTTGIRPRLENATHRASHNSGLSNVRSYKLCRDLVHGGPKSRIAVKHKHVDRPRKISPVFVGKTPQQIVDFIVDANTCLEGDVTHFVNSSRPARNIRVDLQYEFSRNKMSNIVITVTDDRNNIYMKFNREDLECTCTAGNSAPLNWIATVPVDAKRFPHVSVKVNEENWKLFDTKTEIFECSPEVNVIACLIFKNVPGSLCKNWPIITLNTELKPFA